MEPIEREIVDVLLTWPRTWTDWPTADATSLREETVRLLIRAGMLERRIAYSVVFTPPNNWWSRLRGGSTAEQFELVVQVSGHDWSKRFNAVLGKIFPSHWFDNGRLVATLYLRQTGSQVRLTDQGELARHEIESGATVRVLDYVLGRHLFEWYHKTTSHVDIVSCSVPHPLTLNPSANAVAVASANATASVGNITTIIKNELDLSGITKALGEIAAALDKGKPTDAKEMPKGQPSETKPKELSGNSEPARKESEPASTGDVEDLPSLADAVLRLNDKQTARDVLLVLWHHGFNFQNFTKTGGKQTGPEIAQLPEARKRGLSHKTQMKEALSELQRPPFVFLTSPGQGYYLTERGVAAAELLNEQESTSKKSRQSRR